MFKGIREYAASIHAALWALVEATTATPSETLEGLVRRVDALELSIAKERAEAEAVLMKAEAERRTARRAEERTRAMLRGRDEADDGDEASPEDIESLWAHVRAGNGEGSPSGGMSAMPTPVGRSRADKRAAALRAKFTR